MNLALCEGRNLPNLQNSEPQNKKTAKMAVFELLDHPKLISRKI